MHVLIVLCNPNEVSFSHSIARSVIDGIESQGNSYKLIDLHAINFDPVLSKRDLQQFEGVPMPDDVLEQQRLIEEADGLILIFPVYWYGMPAMMKGWLDRVWSAGWAYEWKRDPEGSILKSRPCTVLAPAGASARQLQRWGYEERIQHLWRYGVFGYCGFEPLRIEILDDCEFDSGKHEAHLQTALEVGRMIGNDPKAREGIERYLKEGLDIRGEKYTE